MVSIFLCQIAWEASSVYKVVCSFRLIVDCLVTVAGCQPMN